MKILKIVFFVSISISNIWAQSEKRINAKIDHVTVFLSQAQLDNSLRVNLPQGATKIIVENIANTIDPNSIQVGGTGDFTLLGVKYNRNYLNTKQYSVQDSIKETRYDIENIDMLLAVAANEEKMIMANVDIKSEKDGLLPEDLKEMTDLFRQKLTELGTRKLQLLRQKEPLTERKSRLERQLAEINNAFLPLGEIELSVVANSSTTANIQLSYVANSAGWSPSYDLRVKDVKSPVSIAYKANVYQNTGLDWKSVKLTLSTSNPSVSGYKPELYPFYLSFWVPAPVMRKEARVGGQPEMMVAMAAAPAAEAADMAEMKSIANTVEVVQSSLSVNFEISTLYTIPTGGQAETVEIQSLSADAQYKSMISPKLDPNAFLVAEVKDWEKLNLMNGEANVYFENKFVGKTYISENTTEESMKISLGKDLRITAKREEIENYKARKAVGSNIRESFGYKITVKNAKSEAIKVILEDQVPVSQDSDIEVGVDEMQGGNITPESGKVTWEFDLPATQSKEILLKYTVKYPKNKKVNNL
ncbi:MAG: DUF4139 domain-containing protein [Spirosomataceae bacterium]|jgi:uncharacterized protein (TIGR02231 family)